MKVLRPFSVVVSFFALCLVASLVPRTVQQQPATKLSAVEQQEYEDFLKRFVEQQVWLNNASFAVMHGSDAGFKEDKETVELLVSLEKLDQISRLIHAKGWGKFKERVAKLLKNSDPATRAFGIVWLFVIGGTEYKKDIAKLLDDKPGAPADSLERVTFNIDRCVAAIALGEMGAKEYAPRLVALLKSSDGNDRTGAVQGLRSMGAKEHAKQIAELLSDENDIILYDDVRTAAIETLAEFDATECAEQIASVLKEDVVSYEVASTACYALARLNGKAWSKDIAKQLDGSTRQADAAKALALLDAKEYTNEIARLLDHHDRIFGSKVRSDAIIALGILDAQDFRTQIAAHLRDEDVSVRSYAAVALLLMGDQEHFQEIRDVIHAEWENPKFGFANDPAAHFSARIRLHSYFESHSLLEKRQQQLVQRAVEASSQFNRTEK